MARAYILLKLHNPTVSAGEGKSMKLQRKTGADLRFMYRATEGTFVHQFKRAGVNS